MKLAIGDNDARPILSKLRPLLVDANEEVRKEAAWAALAIVKSE